MYVISAIGCPGIGKSALLEALMEHFVESSEVESTGFFSSDAYSNKNKLLREYSATVASLGDRSIIVVDRCNPKEEHRQDLTDRAKVGNKGVRVLFINFLSTYSRAFNAKLAIERIKLRGDNHPTLKYSRMVPMIVGRILNMYEAPVKNDLGYDVLDVDPMETVERMVERVIAHISK